MANTRNILKQQLDDCKELNLLRAALFHRIDQWESMLVKKVQESSRLAREQVAEILKSKMESIEVELKQVSDKLQVAQKQKNFVEEDLNGLETRS